MVEGKDSEQSIFNLKAAVVILIFASALFFGVMPGMGRAFIYLTNLMNSFFTTLFHDIFPGMDWL